MFAKDIVEMSSFDNLIAYFFGQPSSDYCNLFLILSAFSLVFCFLTIFSFAILLIAKLTGDKSGKITLETIIAPISVIIIHFVHYMIARILYNMCKQSNK